MNKSDFRSINLAPIWELLTVSSGLYKGKKDSPSRPKDWKKDGKPGLTGLVGETAGALITKVPAYFDPYAHEGRAADLKDGTDVKTTTYWPPVLMVAVETTKWADYYALVYLDLADKKCYFIGKVTVEDLKKGTVRNFGYMDDYTLTMEEVIEKSIVEREHPSQPRIALLI